MENVCLQPLDDREVHWVAYHSFQARRKNPLGFSSAEAGGQALEGVLCCCEPRDWIARCLYQSIQRLILTIIDACSGSGFVLPAHNASSSIITRELQKALSAITAFLTARLLIRELMSQQGKHSHRLVSMGLPGLTTHPEVAGLIEKWNGYRRLSCGANRETTP